MSNININMGAKTSKAPVSSSAATRAAATTAVAGPGSVPSDQGTVAVQPQGGGSKFLGFLNKASGLASKLLPGIGGTIAGIVNKLTTTNDPEWWNTIQGDGLTTNEPLSTLSGADINQRQYQMGAVTEPVIYQKGTLLEIISASDNPATQPAKARVIVPDDRMTTQYLMPAVRKVTNAVVLQDADAYSGVFAAQATMYAIWRNLLKFDFFMKTGTPFTPSLNDPMFPIFRPTAAAWLQSTITRLEEYLSANVRLPHTLCEYLTWRYGKIFRTNPSAKSGFIFYDIVSPTMTTQGIDAFITALQTYCSADTSRQKAVADFYNAYLAHDQQVLTSGDSMMAYDAKEFVLRNNLDIMTVAVDAVGHVAATNHHVIMDSNLDNPTVFMASTISCEGYDKGADKYRPALFPVLTAIGYVHMPELIAQAGNPASKGSVLFNFGNTDDQDDWFYDTLLDGLMNYGGPLTTIASPEDLGAIQKVSASWCRYIFRDKTDIDDKESTVSHTAAIWFATYMAQVFDFHNCDVLLPTFRCVGKFDGKTESIINIHGSVEASPLTIDSGVVPDVIIANEQVLAFANLVYEGHRDRTTYKMLEKRVAKDVANYIEGNNIAVMPAANAVKA